MTQLAGEAYVLHAHRLTANGVVGDGEHHERHFSLVLSEHLFEQLKRHIPLERQFSLRIFGFGDSNINSFGMTTLYMTLGGVEMGIAGHHLPLFDQVGEEHVLCCTPLVSGDDITKTGEASDGLFQFEETAGTGVTLVAHHQSRPLTVGHGACS